MSRILTLLCFFLCRSALANPPATVEVFPRSASEMRVYEVSETVWIRQSNGKKIKALAGLKISMNESIETGNDSEATLVLIDGTQIRIAPNSNFQFLSMAKLERGAEIRANLTNGQIRVNRPIKQMLPLRFEVITPQMLIKNRNGKSDFSVVTIVDSRSSLLLVQIGPVVWNRVAGIASQLVGDGYVATTSDDQYELVPPQTISQELFKESRKIFAFDFPTFTQEMRARRKEIAAEEAPLVLVQRTSTNESESSENYSDSEFNADEHEGSVLDEPKSSSERAPSCSNVSINSSNSKCVPK